MEHIVLKCLDNIQFNDNNILNGPLFTCKEPLQDLIPCQNCLSCKLTMLMNFSLSLLNHMTDKDVVHFIRNCSKPTAQFDLANILELLLSPLQSKDRLYSLSRSIPSLNTDLADFSMRNFTINKTQLGNVTQRIARWILQQPDTFRFQFIFSLLSHLKLALLTEIHRSICNHEKKIGDSKNSISNSEITLKEAIELNSYKLDESKYEASNNISENFFLAPKLDLISMLPIHISKYIINMLDEKSLKICSGLCETWKIIVSQVRREFVANDRIKEQAMLLQSVSSTPADPRFARDADVPVPRLEPGTHAIMYLDKSDKDSKKRYSAHEEDISNDVVELLNSRKVFNMVQSYKHIMTKNVIIEERNVYCGGYSVMMITESLPKHKDLKRTISYNGGNFVAIGGANKSIQFLGVKGNQSDLMKNNIHGHAGSITVIRIISKPGKIISGKLSSDAFTSHRDAEVLSGSYDTTIRRWDSVTGKCLKIYIGHSSTITDLDVGEEHFVSGSLDGTCKLWRYNEKNSILTMRHRHPVSAVSISNKLCVSGDSSGLIKVWNIQDGKHIKNLRGHKKDISAVRINNFHILSSSHDCCAMLWSTVGEFDLCIGIFRHPKPILCMDFCYLRGITGCEDGRIRVWNVLNGQCIRVIRGNSRSDPILDMVTINDTIVINTVSNILTLHFEPTDWVYETAFEENKSIIKKSYLTRIQEKQKYNPQTHSYRVAQRRERSRFAGNVDPRIFLSPMIDVMKIQSRKPHTDDSFQSLRSFENGLPLSRCSTWIVSPTLNKTIDISKDSSNNAETVKNMKIPDENLLKELTDRSDEIKRNQTESSSSRRLSYGFERQDHLACDVDLNEMKKTLRKHIRSPPQISAEAMPDFIKTMVSQLKTTTMTGRAVSAVSSNRLNRPSSGPSKVDSKSKLAIDQIKNAITPMSMPLSTSVSENITTGNAQSVSNQPVEKTNTKNEVCALYSSKIKTSSTHSSNQSVISSFLVPPEYRKNLQQKKLEFDQRHQKNNSQPISYSPSSVSNECARIPKPRSVVNHLNLQTFENSRHYLEQIETSNQHYELERKTKAEEEHYEKWLKKAIEVPFSKYEKDAVMRRPRSAKI